LAYKFLTLEKHIFICDSSKMSNDPFSDILKLVKAQSVLTGSFSAGGQWSILFTPTNKIKFFAIVKGGCLLQRNEGQAAIRVETGDVLLLSRDPVTFCNDNDIEPVDATALYAGKCEKVAQLGDGGDFSLLGGYVTLDPDNGGLLADVLPPLIHIRASSPESGVLKWLLGQLIRERDNGQPGNDLATAQISQLMFIQVLRLHLASSPNLDAGWLRAVSDKKLAPALKLMHSAIDRSWQLEDLAKASGMSRTAFAVYFKAVAGVAPLTYLTEWRMRLAEQALREEDSPINVLAGQFGYSSESSFSNAFKRVIGRSPGSCRKCPKSLKLP
jgi:AraC-like DNA-binding protein